MPLEKQLNYFVKLSFYNLQTYRKLTINSSFNIFDYYATFSTITFMFDFDFEVNSICEIYISGSVSNTLFIWGPFCVLTLYFCIHTSQRCFHYSNKTVWPTYLFKSFLPQFFKSLQAGEEWEAMKWEGGRGKEQCCMDGKKKRERDPVSSSGLLHLTFYKSNCLSV